MSTPFSSLPSKGGVLDTREAKVAAASMTVSVRSSDTVWDIVAYRAYLGYQRNGRKDVCLKL